MWSSFDNAHFALVRDGWQSITLEEYRKCIDSNRTIWLELFQNDDGTVSITHQWTEDSLVS